MPDIEAIEFIDRPTEPEPSREQEKSAWGVETPFSILNKNAIISGPYWWAKHTDPDGAAISMLQACWELVNLQKLAGRPIVEGGKRKIEHAIQYLFKRARFFEDEETPF